MSNASLSEGIENAAPAAPKPTPVKGLLILGALVVVIGLFLALGYALGVTQLWVGFVFLLFWGQEQFKFEKLSACILGALSGLGVAYAVQVLPPVLGPAGLAPIVGLILVMMYCAIMGWLTVAINTTCWAFLTIGTISVIQAQVDFRGSFVALALGITYFAGLAWLAQLFMQRAAAKT